MALNVGENFKHRWLNTPEAVRQTFCDELMHISALLEPETSVTAWQQQETLLQHQHRRQIKHAYAQLKQDILAEQARLAEEHKRKIQAELEAKIEHARAREREYLFDLRQQDILRQQHELTQLQQISEQLKTELKHQAVQQIPQFDSRFSKQFNQSKLSFEDIQLRLEIESEAMIENLLDGLRVQLKHAAQEEIQLMIKGYRQKLASDQSLALEQKIALEQKSGLDLNTPSESS